MRHALAVAVMLALAPAVARGQGVADSVALMHAVGQLRDAVGSWDVTTEFLNEDGSVARSAVGTYRFEWVVPDRVVSGVSTIPALELRSAILFYVNPTKRVVEMVSVGADGRLWIMSGPLGGETRTTPPYATADGGTGQLRFTRFNVSADRFESRMEYSSDGGANWLPGNHQVFERSS